MDYSPQHKTESKLQPSSNSSYDQTAAVSYNKHLSYSNTEWKKVQSTLNDTIHSDLVTYEINDKLTADEYPQNIIPWHKMYQSFRRLRLKKLPFLVVQQL